MIQKRRLGNGHSSVVNRKPGSTVDRGPFAEPPEELRQGMKALMDGALRTGRERGEPLFKQILQTAQFITGRAAAAGASLPDIARAVVQGAVQSARESGLEVSKAASA